MAGSQRAFPPSPGTVTVMASPVAGSAEVIAVSVPSIAAMQGDASTSKPLDVARIALPLLAYFALMWAGSFALGRLAVLAATAQFA